MDNTTIQNKNENFIYKTNRKTFFTKDNIITNNLYEKIIDELNLIEKHYSFPSIEEKSLYIYNKNTYNVFLMHDDHIHELFQKVSDLVKKACLENQFSYSKNKYYTYATLFENQDTEFWYDAGGTSRPAMFGLISIDDTPSCITINNTEFMLNPGDILISEAGSKITYLNKFKSLIFYVSPLSEIKNQYSQKWIPLV